MLASEPADAPFLETLTSLRFYDWTHLWVFSLWLRFIHPFPNCVPIKSLFLECFFLWIFSGLAISSDIMASMDSSMWLTAEDVSCCVPRSYFHFQQPAFISNSIEYKHTLDIFVALVPAHCNKVNITERQVTWIFQSLGAYKSYLYNML